MPTVTAIELGLESCVVAKVRARREEIELSAVRGLKDDDWDVQRPLAENLEEARRRDRLPKRARVVAWGLHESASAADPATRSLVAPLREAGFDVETVMSPAQALAELSRRRPRPAGRAGAVWLALNRQGAAIAIVDAGELLYSREFTWHYRPASSVKEELLQRYSLVAHLAPEVRHGLEIVRTQREVAISAIVTCGDLPDLRSLTMPLIEELDIEVETLDTFDGMALPGDGDREELLERASALQLAATVGATDPSAANTVQQQRWLAAAAVVVAIGLASWLFGRTPLPASTDRPPARVAATTSPRPAPPTQPRPAGSVARSSVAEPEAHVPSAAPVLSPPATATDRPIPVNAKPAAGPRAAADGSTPAATSGRQAAPPVAPTAAVHSSVTALTAPTPPSPLADRTIAGPTRRPRAKPLNDPLPQVNSILVAPDRRLAVIAGEIVREGDTIGSRVLTRIEPNAVMLREPSGQEVRVPIRRKLN